MMQDRDYVADQLRNELLENLDRDGLVDAIRDQFISGVADSADPIDHPWNYASATPQQQEALRKILAGVADYVRASRIDDEAIDQRIALVLGGAA